MSATSAAVVIDTVAPGSRAERAGLRPGTRIHAVNGAPVRDVLELYFRESSGRLLLEIEDEQGERQLRIAKRTDESLGITLRPTPDLACKEKCVFCFVHQLPKGLRKSLYFKDDDYRLSFLHGNFVTLTNAPEGAVERIIEQRLSPLYVSVHDTDPVRRGKLLGAKGPAPILPILERFAAAELTFYGQIVLCPGLNDGGRMEETLEALAALYPSCQAVAVVPLGLTDHRRNLPAMRPFEVADAVACLDGLRRLQPVFRERLGSSFAFGADELYLKACRALPRRAHYEDLPMLEDGIGMWRTFVDGFEGRLRRATRRRGRPRRIRLVTGRLFAPTLDDLCRRLAERTGHDLAVVPATNLLFGAGITVAGLLSGRCVKEALASSCPDGADAALVPGSMLAQPDPITLDDAKLADLSAELGYPVASGGRTAGELFDAIAELLA